MLLDIKNVTKRYGNTLALDDVSLQVGEGEIVGLFGPNGAGKTTLLRAMLGLSNVEGEMTIAGFNPKTQPTELMKEVSFIADTAILPRWIKVCDCLDYVQNIHPKFDRSLAEKYLAETKILPKSKVSQLSKGMITQLHLAIVMSIDASLLVLDEPTLGLDIVFRKNFYRDLLDNYFDKNKTIVITTHQIEEIEDLVSRVVFINDGKIVLNESVSRIPERFYEVRVQGDKIERAEGMSPMYATKGLEGASYWFDSVEKQVLEDVGQVRVPKLADLFVAIVMRAKAGGVK